MGYNSRDTRARDTEKFSSLGFNTKSSLNIRETKYSSGVKPDYGFKEMFSSQDSLDKKDKIYDVPSRQSHMGKTTEIILEEPLLTKSCESLPGDSLKVKMGTTESGTTPTITRSQTKVKN